MVPREAVPEISGYVSPLMKQNNESRGELPRHRQNLATMVSSQPSTMVDRVVAICFLLPLSIATKLLLLDVRNRDKKLM